MNGPRNSILLSAFLSMLLFHSRTATSQEVEDEREFNYLEGSGHGPEHWGELNTEWELCKNGDMQSPIDLLDERVQVVPDLGKLKRSYKPTNAILKNRGHDIMLKWVDSAGSIHINGTQYWLHQFHWHSPSEHTIQGRRYDLEMHMVHGSSDGKIAVIGIMYKIGRPDTFLSELTKHIEAIADAHEGERQVGVIDPRHLKIGSRMYHRYIGSLTVPPCTQGVLWTIIKKIRTVSREQVRLLRKAVNDDFERNARPTQAINKRAIHLYRPRPDDLRS
ncbi:alpha carbonic anhydrase 7-like [Magnolia sinica]|uniref:alpha carbonic anhydrase 7-like n=1 Tax=Magnolia sinica TaxID=86752 RepID=UPI002659B441|nr:alpha carbonic anhydrase 7-like [Magnolia sinica]